MANVEQLKQRFVELHGGSAADIRVFFAPGRVNLIGEHTDYNGGYVFPAALTFGTFMLIRKREDDVIRLASTNFELQVDFKLKDAVYEEAHDWGNYPKSILVHLAKRGFTFGGYDVLYHGEIPNGAGLSSSASIHLATAIGFMTMEGHPIDRVQLALAAQEAENQFMGVQCGIMDQFVIANGKKDHAVLLMCSTLEYQLVPFQAKGYKIVVGNTNKRRGLVDSEYNTRRAQCEQAVIDLQAAFPNLKLLGELTLEQFEANAHLIKDVIVLMRARHVVEEIDRVLKSVEALKANDLARFGELMTASGVSLRELYEVTCKELDVMVEEALKVEGVLGSRMTGAGFGGCTVSLVREDKVEEFIEKVGKAYGERTDYKADFYVADIGDGASEYLPQK
jgi:galactokinase